MDNQKQNGQINESKNNTQKKNPPISFKLDLSKCTNQQSEEDDDGDDEIDSTNFLKVGGGGMTSEDQDSQYDIPGLQHVKVTDDSFRQYQKTTGNASSNLNAQGQQQLNSTRGKNLVL